MSYRKGSSVGLAGLLLFGFVGCGTCTVAPHFSRDTYVAKVTEKTVKRNNDDDEYLVFTELRNGSVRVFENTDSLLEGKFNSSDVYARIKVGETYRLETYGWRIPALSAYENIVGVEKVE